MRLAVACLFPVLVAAAFMAGRVTGPDTAAASASAIYTGRQGDVFRVPSTATRCLVTVEGAFPRSFAAGSAEGAIRWTSLERASSFGATGTPTLRCSPLGGGRRPILSPKGLRTAPSVTFAPPFRALEPPIPP
jgi:hypothetical protein